MKGLWDKNNGSRGIMWNSGFKTVAAWTPQRQNTDLKLPLRSNKQTLKVGWFKGTEGRATTCIQSWSFLVLEGDEQTDRPKSQTSIEWYWIIFGGWHKHNSLPLGPLQPSSPSTEMLQCIQGSRPYLVTKSTFLHHPNCIYLKDQIIFLLTKLAILKPTSCWFQNLEWSLIKSIPRSESFTNRWTNKHKSIDARKAKNTPQLLHYCSQMTKGFCSLSLFLLGPHLWAYFCLFSFFSSNKYRTNLTIND